MSEKKGIKVPAAKMQKKSKGEKINLIHLLTGRQRRCLRWKKKRGGWRRDLRRNKSFRSQLVIPAKKIRKISQRWKTPEPRKEKRWVFTE